MPQTRFFRRFAMLLATFGLAVSVLIAGQQTLSAKDLILTKRTVELFLASYPDVKVIAERHVKKKGDDISGASDPL
ncbi:MAG: hypothetical protein KTR19_09495, partial [Hyphomicrobiales bacterium]|nr:hypothetical protein [Hyphomicrobiales bacterium]